MAKAMQYEKSGRIESLRADIERSVFRDMSLVSMFLAVGHELWRRGSTEILTTALFGSWALYFWIKLG